jgi:ribosome-associated protein
MDTKTMSVSIHDEYITLGQLIKLVKLIKSGGEEKAFLAMHDITVNGEKEIRRGRKVRPGDTLVIDGKTYQICSSNA